MTKQRGKASKRPLQHKFLVAKSLLKELAAQKKERIRDEEITRSHHTRAF